MKKYALVLALVWLFLPSPGRAQTVLVTGTVTDPNGVPYAGATLKAQLTLSGVNVTGQPVVTVSNQAQCISAGMGNAPCKIPFSGTVGPVTLDGSGNIPGGGIVMQDTSLVTPAATQWTFSVNLSPGVPPPLGTGPQTFSLTLSSIVGVNVNIGAALSAVAPKLTVSSSTGAVGPVINVTNPPYAASASLTDNATAFTAAASAANTTAYVSVGTPTIRSTVATVMSNGTISSATATVNISAGDTVLIGTIALNGPAVLTYSVSDGVNTYYPINLNSSPVGTFNEQVQVFGTPPGAAKAFSGTLTVTISAGGPAQFGFIVLDAFNVGSYGQGNLFNSASANNTPTVNVTTQDNNNLIATWIDYCNAAGVTISANTGTLQQSWNSNATICGAGLVTNTAASLNTSVTTSASLSAGSTWAVNGIELRSVATVQPTVYFPAGRYNYSSGLNFTKAVTLKGEPGTVLCYMGTAHAVDMGPSGLTFATLQAEPYIIDGIRFECGAGMTQGIVFQAHVIYGEVRNSVFYNFGNGSSAAIFSNGDSEDLRIVNNRFLIFDGAPLTLPVPSRTFVNVSTLSAFSQMTFKQNFAFCGSAKQGPNVGCGAQTGTAGTLLMASSFANIIEGNLISGGFCPAFSLLGSGGNFGAGSRISNNDIETDQSNCYGITYQTGVVNVKILNNFWSNKASTPTSAALLGPFDTGQLLVNFEVSGNSIVNNPTNNPIVAQNNLASQTGNIGWHNTCSTGQATGTTPCPLLHTSGGNINQWNNDYGGTCTMAAGACTAYSFLTTYGAAPKCTASWNGSGTLTGLIKAVSTTSTLTISSSVGTDTAVINWTCNPEAQ